VGTLWSDWPKQSIRKNPRSAGLKPHHKEGASKTVGGTNDFGKPLSSVEASSRKVEASSMVK